jgi:putative MFS transporter
LAWPSERSHGAPSRIGRRKKAFSLTLLVFALFSVLGALSPTWEIFLVLRFLAGIGLGGCIPVDYALVGEFSPKKHRGRVLTALDTWWPVGTTFAGLAATLLVPLPGKWRWMLAVMILPALLLFWVRRGVPESPIYLARMGREAEARAVIDDLVARTGGPWEPYVIPAAPPVAHKTGALRAAGQQLRRVWAFNPKLTPVAWALFIAVLTLYYAALSLVPSILRTAGYGDIVAFATTTVMNAAGILGVIASVVLVELVGRRWLIGVAAPLMAVALVGFSLVLQGQTATIFMIAIFGFLTLVVVPTMYAYVAELYPTEIRASGFGWASSSSRAVAGFVPLIATTLLLPSLGLTATFIVLGALLLAAVLWMAIGAPETRGRELDHITGDETPVILDAGSTATIDKTATIDCTPTTGRTSA